MTTSIGAIFLMVAWVLGWILAGKFGAPTPPAAKLVFAFGFFTAIPAGWILDDYLGWLVKPEP